MLPLLDLHTIATAALDVDSLLQPNGPPNYPRVAEASAKVNGVNMSARGKLAKGDLEGWNGADGERMADVKVEDAVQGMVVVDDGLDLVL